MLAETPINKGPEDVRIGAFVHPATARCFEGELSQEELELVLRRFASSQSLKNESRACVILGYGSQREALYRELAQLEGIELVWHANFGPWWMTPLLWLAASHGGLFTINRPEVVPDVFIRLSCQAMVEMYSFAYGLREEVEAHVRRHARRSEIGTVVGRDPGYLCLGVDGDNYDVPSGIFGWCTFGEQCPPDLSAPVTSVDP